MEVDIEKLEERIKFEEDTLFYPKTSSLQLNKSKLSWIAALTWVKNQCIIKEDKNEE